MPAGCFFSLIALALKKNGHLLVVPLFQIVLTLKAKRSRVGLSELKVYLMDDPDTWLQTNYITASGVAVLTSDDDTPNHDVDEVSAVTFTCGCFFFFFNMCSLGASWAFVPLFHV